MSTKNWVRWAVRSLVLATALQVLMGGDLSKGRGLLTARAQDAAAPAADGERPADAGPDAKGDAKSEKAPRKRAETRGRLPAYFGEVVSADQRDKIYELQAKIAAEIQKLQQQIEMLEENREKEVLAILTPEQLAKVKSLQDEAKAKRAAAAGRKKSEAASTAVGESTR